MTNRSILAAVAPLAVAAALLSGCGGDAQAGDTKIDLTEDDFQVCFYSHDLDADRVYEHAATASNPDLLEIAGRIKDGSSPAEDRATMTELNEWCDDEAGYDYDRDGRWGDPDRQAEADAAASAEASRSAAAEAADPSHPSWVDRMMWTDAGHPTGEYPIDGLQGILQCEGPSAVVLVDDGGSRWALTPDADPLVEENHDSATAIGDHWETGEPLPVQPLFDLVKGFDC